MSSECTSVYIEYIICRECEVTGRFGPIERSELFPVLSPSGNNIQASSR